MKAKHLFILPACALLAVSSARATLLSADFRSTADYYGSAVIYESLNKAVGAGYEIGAADTPENTSGLKGGDIFVDLDPAAGVLTLTPQSRGTFSTYELWIDNAVFSNPTEYFSSFSRPSGRLGDNAYLATVSFTNNSLHIYYTSVTAGEFTTYLNPVTFSVATIASPVPEPEQGAMLLSGVAALALRLRKRIKEDGDRSKT